MQSSELLSAELMGYAGAFGVGLLTTVYAMLHGSVRTQANASVKPPRAAFNAFVIGAALIGVGAVGYMLVKYSHLSTISTVVLALVGGAVGWTGMTVLMAQWALKGPLDDPHEELEELQGTVASVTQAIGVDTLGEIAYAFRGDELHVPARCIGGETAGVGTEVVIERIENGVADVELWSAVEQRL